MKKVCTREVTLKESEGLLCFLKPGDVVFIPVTDFHYDRNHWTRPNDFNPDRFDSDNRNDRHKFVFLPFSEQPRICPPMRLGMMVVLNWPLQH